MSFKSVLFVPAANERAVAKAPSLGCDALIYDLEDSVFNDQKPLALAALIARLAAQTMVKPSFVRLNQKNAASEAQRLRHLCEAGHISGFVLSKVETPDDFAPFKAMNVPLMAMIETPMAVVNLKDIAKEARGGRLKGLILGPNDLRFYLRAKPMPDRAELSFVMSALVTHARAFGIMALDGVYNHFSDADGFCKECQQARALGFDGNTLIHPSQIAPANQAFLPSADEKIWAEAVMAAFEAEPQKSVINFNGAMLELMHLARASEILSA
jgi:citrate lyase subunit beta/citryl-CoA lyase/(3S)-malyl-CoA thioesterase